MDQAPLTLALEQRAGLTAHFTIHSTEIQYLRDILRYSIFTHYAYKLVLYIYSYTNVYIYIYIYISIYIFISYGVALFADRLVSHDGVRTS